MSVFQPPTPTVIKGRGILNTPKKRNGWRLNNLILLPYKSRYCKVFVLWSHLETSSPTTDRPSHPSTHLISVISFSAFTVTDTQPPSSALHNGSWRSSRRSGKWSHRESSNGKQGEGLYIRNPKILSRKRSTSFNVSLNFWLVLTLISNLLIHSCFLFLILLNIFETE